jgi:hypothetical protein
MSASRGRPREANPNWRGGRTVTRAGYVLIRMPEHPAADVRGYVYEHRLVMEAALGRLLRHRERVRHADGNPGNNNPANLRLVEPLDRVATTSCACGCGTVMTKLDKAGRVRHYVSGHNSARRRTTPGPRPRHETGAGLPEADREHLLDMFKGQCAYGCGRSVSCWDHVIPWSAGGSFKSPGNAVPACKPCNQQKSDNDVWAWIDRGLASDQGDAWADLVGLALSWGALDVPEDEFPQEVALHG